RRIRRSARTCAAVQQRAERPPHELPRFNGRLVRSTRESRARLRLARKNTYASTPARPRWSEAEPRYAAEMVHPCRFISRSSRLLVLALAACNAAKEPSSSSAPAAAVPGASSPARASGAAPVAQSPMVQGEQPHAGMLRFPDVSATHIAFVYADDLWLVPREGGVATPLASPPGSEALPRFRPDGKTIAFMANYDGNSDLCTMPVGGGVPVRVTHHPAAEVLCGWTPDGKLLFYTNGLAGRDRQMQLFTVSATGGLPEPLPVPYGAFADVSPDGRWLAY